MVFHIKRIIITVSLSYIGFWHSKDIFICCIRTLIRWLQLKDLVKVILGWICWIVISCLHLLSFPYQFTSCFSSLTNFKNIKKQQNHHGNYVSLKFYHTEIEYLEHSHVTVTHYHTCYAFKVLSYFFIFVLTGKCYFTYY